MRRCTVCSSEHLAAIGRDLTARIPLEQIASRWVHRNLGGLEYGINAPIIMIIAHAM